MSKRGRLLYETRFVGAHYGHPKRRKYLTAGNPIKLSNWPAKVRRSPLLGEHTSPNRSWLQCQGKRGVRQQI